MIRKALLVVLALLLLAAAAFFIFAPAYVDADMNAVDGESLPEISQEARDLHASLTIVDLHSDTLLWKRDMLTRYDYGHMDLPRLQEGNVALQVFSSVTKTPAGLNYDGNSGDSDQVTMLVFGQLQPPRTWFSLLERSLYHAQKLDEAAADSEGGLAFVRSAADLAALNEARVAGGRQIGGLFSAEGLHSLEGDIANLEVLYDAGMRMAGLTHFFDNELAGSMHGVERGGLTDLGPRHCAPDGRNGHDRRYCPLQQAVRHRSARHGAASGGLQPWRGASNLRCEPQSFRRAYSRGRSDRRDHRHRLLGRRGVRHLPRSSRARDAPCARSGGHRACRLGQRLRRHSDSALRHGGAGPCDAGSAGGRLHRRRNPRGHGRQMQCA